MSNRYTRYFPHLMNRVGSKFSVKALDLVEEQMPGVNDSANQYFSNAVNADFTADFAENDFSPQEDRSYLKVVHLKQYPDLSLSVRILKRIFDIAFSLSVMVLGCPVFILLYFITKFSSSGPAFYYQERIGKDGCPFYIYKFRSMYTDAEKMGPQLSSETDPRITKWGRVIRRTRLDELPQFWNVLIGDMSVVGSRPERQYFIDQIIQRNPAYTRLQGLKPGITSMGQVHYGYAENVEQMCARMMYDLNYMQCVSLNTDLKVIMKTIKVMVQCKGK